jgi:hypothetical protein
MNITMKLTAVALLGAGAFLAACGDDETSTTTTTSTTATTSSAGGAGGTGPGAGGGGGAGGDIGPVFPPAPKLGAQIDRMGRPAINTVGSKTFDKANRDAALDAYNKEGDLTKWSAYAADIAASLAILDALDKADNADPAMAGCGNQVAAGGKQTKGTYDTLAGVLADDRLWVKLTAKGGCGLYLGVEANFLGVTNDTCGGRTPVDDVVDESYSLLSGAFDFSKLPGNPFLFGDGIPVEPATKTAYEAGFPYFAAKK